MPQLRANGIQIEYEVSGDPKGPPVLLIMGLGAQLTRWPDPFHRALADAGYRVIRYDNRDAGLSTRMSGMRGTPLPLAALCMMLGLPIRAPYLLADLAADAIGLLDGLGVASAHVVGASMGGMIGQLLAAHHASRTRTLVSIMSSSGSARLPQPDWRIRLALIRGGRGQTDRAKAIESVFSILKLIRSPGFPPDDAALRAQVTREVDRAYYPGGVRRQLLAIVASGSRTKALREIDVPTLVLHGAADPLIPVAAAYDLHRRIAGARMEIFAGMAHDLPTQLVPAITSQIIAHFRRAEAGSRAGDGVA